MAGVLDELRIGAREREAAIAILGDHFALGRLETEEYEQRVDAALRARTRGELRPLFRDLPPPHPPSLGDPGLVDSRRLPGPLRATLEAEGVLLLEENVRGSITYRRYRAPGKRTGWERVPLVATVAVTGRRLVAWAPAGKQVDLTFGHPLRAAVTFSVESPDVLCLDVDAAAFHPDRSGRMEYRFHTRHAATIRDFFGG